MAQIIFNVVFNFCSKHPFKTHLKGIIFTDGTLHDSTIFFIFSDSAFVMFKEPLSNILSSFHKMFTLGFRSSISDRIY